jgi:UDP-N-acetylmuramate dehydrogenase
VSGDLARAEAVLRAACGERVRTAVPLAPFTTFRVGGPAALFLEAASEDDLRTVAEVVRELALPVLVVGRGSNLLVSDAGFPGLALRLGAAFRWTAVEPPRLRAGAATALPALAGTALRHGLAGFEWAVAVPASLGGAIRMNAGAHGGEIAEVLETAEVLDLSTGERAVVKAEDAGFRYRGSSLPDPGVVLAGTLMLRPGDPELIRARMDGIREWRRRHQPLAEPSCGSVFKNPPDAHAARLIEEASLKGLSVGGAEVSVKHANFIVTRPGARAEDVAALIRTVQERVAERTGIVLEPEVHLVGTFDHLPH